MNEFTLQENPATVTDDGTNVRASYLGLSYRLSFGLCEWVSEPSGHPIPEDSPIVNALDTAWGRWCRAADLRRACSVCYGTGEVSDNGECLVPCPKCQQAIL